MYKQSFDIYFEKDQKQTGSPWILDEPSWIERPAAASCRQLSQNFKMSDKLNRWESLIREGVRGCERVREGAVNCKVTREKRFWAKIDAPKSAMVLLPGHFLLQKGMLL